MSDRGWDAKAKTFDCQQCGACCVSPVDEVEYVALGEADLKTRNDPQASKYLNASGTSLLTKQCRQGRVCQALRGVVGEKCGCSIYTARPEACSRFEAGSWPCIETRKEIFGDDCQPDFPQ